MPSLPLPLPHAPHSPHPYSTRIKALAVYAETNSAAEAARVCGLPDSTVRQWTESEEGQAFVGELRERMRNRFGWIAMEQIAKVHALIDLTLTEGEPVVTKQGIVYERPKLRDLGTTLGILIDKSLAYSAGAKPSTNPDRQLKTLVDGLMNEIAKLVPKANEPNASPSPPNASSYLG